MSTLLPLFYFKPSICWIDDDQFFLDAIKVTLGSKYNLFTFNNPQEAIHFFESYNSPLANIKLKREFTESDTFGTNERFQVDFNISEIRKIDGNKNRINEIAVLGIDYNMPKVNGLEVCKKLQGIQTKKILMTGDASHEKAVEAFNKGLINKFMKKDINVADKISDCIDELVYQYFQDQSSFLISHIEASRTSLFTDKIFINFFDKLLRSHQITEFYLLNKNGCYLLKDSGNKKYYFIVMSETNKNEFLQMNNELTSRIAGLLTEVKQGKKIPFFGVGKEAWELDINEWDKHFLPAEKISGRENYYWTVAECNE